MLTLKEELSFIAHTRTLTEYRERYPDIYSGVSGEIGALLEKRDPKSIASFIGKLRSESDLHAARIKSSGGNDRVAQSSFPFIVREKIGSIILDKLFLAVSSGTKSGRVRFTLFNGFLLQKLLFKRGFERKTAPYFLYTLLWPLVTQKNLLMPLVAKKGISCFYSSRFIAELAKRLDGVVLEIGAGDGALSKALTGAGSEIHATDNYSWSHLIKYPDFVEKLDAQQALAKYDPHTVICSWPTPGNKYEKFIFAHKSVKRYIMIGSAHEFATGNWDLYRSVKGFIMKPDAVLSKTLLPKENGNLVLVFERE